METDFEKPKSFLELTKFYPVLRPYTTIQEKNCFNIDEFTDAVHAIVLTLNTQPKLNQIDLEDVHSEFMEESVLSNCLKLCGLTIFDLITYQQHNLKEIELPTRSTSDTEQLIRQIEDSKKSPLLERLKEAVKILGIGKYQHKQNLSISPKSTKYPDLTKQLFSQNSILDKDKTVEHFSQTNLQINYSQLPYHTIKTQMPTIAELTGFAGNITKISKNPISTVELSPLAELDKKVAEDVKIELKINKIRENMLKQGQEPPRLIEAELTSGDENSTDSAISQEGIPDKDLQYIIDDQILTLIEDRRTKRRATKIKALIDAEAINSVVNLIGKFHEDPYEVPGFKDNFEQMSMERQNLKSKLKDLLLNTDITQQMISTQTPNLPSIKLRGNSELHIEPLTVQLQSLTPSQPSFIRPIAQYRQASQLVKKAADRMTKYTKESQSVLHYLSNHTTKLKNNYELDLSSVNQTEQASVADQEIKPNLHSFVADTMAILNKNHVQLKEKISQLQLSDKQLMLRQERLERAASQVQMRKLKPQKSRKKQMHNQILKMIRNQQNQSSQTKQYVTTPLHTQKVQEMNIEIAGIVLQNRDFLGLSKTHKTSTQQDMSSEKEQTVRSTYSYYPNQNTIARENRFKDLQQVYIPVVQIKNEDIDKGEQILMKTFQKDQNKSTLDIQSLNETQINDTPQLKVKEIGQIQIVVEHGLNQNRLPPSKILRKENLADPVNTQIKENPIKFIDQSILPTTLQVVGGNKIVLKDVLPHQQPMNPRRSDLQHQKKAVAQTPKERQQQITLDNVLSIQTQSESKFKSNNSQANFERIEAEPAEEQNQQNKVKINRYSPRTRSVNPIKTIERRLNELDATDNNKGLQSQFKIKMAVNNSRARKSQQMVDQSLQVQKIELDTFLGTQDCVFKSGNQSFNIVAISNTQQDQSEQVASSQFLAGDLIVGLKSNSQFQVTKPLPQQVERKKFFESNQIYIKAKAELHPQNSTVLTTYPILNSPKVIQQQRYQKFEIDAMHKQKLHLGGGFSNISPQNTKKKAFFVSSPPLSAQPIIEVPEIYSSLGHSKESGNTSPSRFDTQIFTNFVEEENQKTLMTANKNFQESSNQDLIVLNSIPGSPYTVATPNKTNCFNSSTKAVHNQVKVQKSKRSDSVQTQIEQAQPISGKSSQKQLQDKNQLQLNDELNFVSSQIKERKFSVQPQHYYEINQLLQNLCSPTGQRTPLISRQIGSQLYSKKLSCENYNLGKLEMFEGPRQRIIGGESRLHQQELQTTDLVWQKRQSPSLQLGPIILLSEQKK